MQRHFTREQVASFVADYQTWSQQIAQIIDVLLLPTTQPLWLVRYKMTDADPDMRKCDTGITHNDIITEKKAGETYTLYPLVDVYLPTGCATVAEEDKAIDEYNKERRASWNTNLSSV